MIDSLIIRNFETHLDTEVELHPGVNTFVGESDEGKSGIVRAIRWNAKNRPQGDSYRNDKLDPKKKEDKLKLTEVAVDYKDGGVVTRARDGFPGGINHYQIDDGEPLRALRTDIPDEVKDVSKMKDVNIQGQHPTEQYFLLADKPGQVAKEFNKVSGLTIMDKATADINSQVRTCNSKINASKEEIKTRQEEVNDTVWVDTAEKLANKLGAFKVKVDDKQAEYDSLHDKIIHVMEIEGILAKYYEGVDDAVKTLEDLKKERQSIIDAQDSIEQITDLISAMTEIDLQLNESIDIDKALKSLKSLIFDKDKIKKTEIELQKIKSLLGKIDYNDKELKIAERDVVETQKEYDIMREEQECPTCGRTGK